MCAIFAPCLNVVDAYQMTYLVDYQNKPCTVFLVPMSISIKRSNLLIIYLPYSIECSTDSRQNVIEKIIMQHNRIVNTQYITLGMITMLIVFVRTNE